MKRPPIPKPFLGAFKAGHRKAARDFIDEEYSYELLNRVLDSGYKDLEALHLLEYITKFNNEFHKNVVKKDDPTALHNTKELRQSCYRQENSRNRDLMGGYDIEQNFNTGKTYFVQQEFKMSVESDEFWEQLIQRNLNSQEDALIQLIQVHNLIL